MGIAAGDFFEVGQPLDAVVYRGDSPLLGTAGVEHLLPTLVYTADGSSVLGTLVDGEWITRDLHHRNEDEILQDFQRALKNISSTR